MIFFPGTSPVFSPLHYLVLKELSGEIPEDNKSQQARADKISGREPCLTVSEAVGSSREMQIECWI